MSKTKEDISTEAFMVIKEIAETMGISDNEGIQNAMKYFYLVAEGNEPQYQLLPFQLKGVHARTQKQNSSLHLYCTQLATSLNDAGLDMKRVLKPEIEIPWTKDSVKDHLWRPIQSSMFGFDETRKLKTTQTTQVYETLDRHLASKFGVHIEWPSIDSMSRRGSYAAKEQTAQV